MLPSVAPLVKEKEKEHESRRHAWYHTAGQQREHEEKRSPTLSKSKSKSTVPGHTRQHMPPYAEKEKQKQKQRYSTSNSTSTSTSSSSPTSTSTSTSNKYKYVEQVQVRRKVAQYRQHTAASAMTHRGTNAKKQRHSYTPQHMATYQKSISAHCAWPVHGNCAVQRLWVVVTWLFSAVSLPSCLRRVLLRLTRTRC